MEPERGITMVEYEKDPIDSGEEAQHCAVCDDDDGMDLDEPFDADCQVYLKVQVFNASGPNGGRPSVDQVEGITDSVKEHVAKSHPYNGPDEVAEFVKVRARQPTQVQFQVFLAVDPEVGMKLAAMDSIRDDVNNMGSFRHDEMSVFSSSYNQ